jgi:hypothetical protein
VIGMNLRVSGKTLGDFRRDDVRATHVLVIDTASFTPPAERSRMRSGRSTVCYPPGHA